MIPVFTCLFCLFLSAFLAVFAKTELALFISLLIFVGFRFFFFLFFFFLLCAFHPCFTFSFVAGCSMGYKETFYGFGGLKMEKEIQLGLLSNLICRALGK
ncbi:hypothetical protein [Escherichia coli]|uniref:hypothetical protein n=1 Tax=Escherichia coli TaxID=562 RepID=UPI0035E3E163